MTTPSPFGQRAPTLKDVALRAGVNKVTVSVVLNGGSGNTRVSEATSQRIIQVAKELGYHPNALARSLRRKKSQMIGFYMSGHVSLADLFMGEIVSGLQEECERNHRDFLIHGAFRGASIDDIYAEIVNGKVDGLVLFSDECDKLSMLLAESYLPVVSVANPLKNVPSVTVDDAGGARMLAEHLVSRGHRQVIYGQPPYTMPSATRRCEAFMAAAKELGLHADVRSARTSDHIPSEAELEILQASPANRPTAFVCWNDTFAYKAIAYLTANGLRVPQDIAVTGFDGSTSTIPPLFRLTTIRCPWRKAAVTAANLLINSDGKPSFDEISLPVEFVLGETS
jgi:LacI family transcriptional regulator/LacI family purine nucleotide synthesis repressor